MKTHIWLAIVAVFAGSILSAEARDTRHMLPISAALAKGDSFKETLDKNVRLYFANQPTPAVVKQFGEWTSNKKTNAANKSDEDACDIAFISALIALQQRAKQEGGNAVINIHSVYKNENVKSNKEYLCGAGAIMAGVALRGNVVTLK